MIESNDTRWKQLSVEALAIVLSILMAFAIDAWWDEQQERLSEQEYLTAILADIDTVLAEAERTIAGNNALNESARRRIETFRSDEILSESDVVALLDENWSSYRLRASLDSYTDLLSSGSVTIISSPRVRNVLATLRTEMDFEHELHLIGNDAGSIIRPLLHEALDAGNFSIIARIEEDAIGIRAVQNDRKSDVQQAALKARSVLLAETL